MSRITTLIGLVAVVGLASTTFADKKTASKIEALKTKRDQLNKEVRRKLYHQLFELKQEAAQHKDLSSLQKRIQEAWAIYDKKRKEERLKFSSTLGKKAVAEKAVAAAIAKDPSITRLKKQQTANEKTVTESETQIRIAKMMLNEIRQQLAQTGPVQSKRESIFNAEQKLKDVSGKDKKLSALKKTAEQTRKAYLAKIKLIPEYAAMVKAQDAYEKSIKATREYRNVEIAKKALDQTLDSAVQKDKKASQQRKKIEQSEKRIKAAKEKMNSLRDQMRTAESKSEKVTSAKDELRKVQMAHYKETSKRTRKEFQAVLKLKSELNKKVEERIASNPKAKSLQLDIDKVEAQIKKLDQQIRELSPKPSTKKKKPRAKDKK